MVYWKIRYLFGLLLFLFPLLSYSQVYDSIDHDNNLYFISLKDKLSIHVYGITKFNHIELKSPSGDTLIRYQPNENFNVGAGFNYEWAGISAAFNFKLFNNDDPIYGKTKSYDLQSDIFSRRTLWTINFQSYTGFYWGNVNEFDTTWNVKDSVPIRPDIRTVNLGTNMIYTINHKKFSFKAPYTYTELQKRSAGSGLLGIQLSYYGMKADSTIVPYILWPNYPIYGSMTDLITFSLGSSIGYSYTLVLWKHFYINATLMLGLSIQSIKASSQSGRMMIDESKLSTKSHARLSLGVNNEKCYYGISAILDSYPIRNEFQSEFIYNYGKFRIFYGRHLNWEGIKRSD
jgi:hypothetical protein